MSATVLADRDPDRLKWILDHQEHEPVGEDESPLVDCDGPGDPETGMFCSLRRKHTGAYHLARGMIHRRVTEWWYAAWPVDDARVLLQASHTVDMPADLFGPKRLDAERMTRDAAVASVAGREVVDRGGVWFSDVDTPEACHYRYTVLVVATEDDLR